MKEAFPQTEGNRRGSGEGLLGGFRPTPVVDTGLPLKH
jgi:hypothetical protein